MHPPYRSTRTLVAIVCVLLSVVGCASSAGVGHGETRATTRPDRSVEWKAWEYLGEDGHNVVIGDAGAMVWYRASTRDAFGDVVKHYEGLSGIAGLGEHQPGGTLSEGPSGTEAYRTTIGVGAGTARPTPDECRFILRKPTYSVTALIRQTSPAMRTSIEIIYETR